MAVYKTYTVSRLWLEVPKHEFLLSWLLSSTPKSHLLQTLSKQLNLSQILYTYYVFVHFMC